MYEKELIFSARQCGWVRRVAAEADSKVINSLSGMNTKYKSIFCAWAWSLWMFIANVVLPHSHDLISQLSIKRSGWQWLNYIQMMGCNILGPGAAAPLRCWGKWERGDSTLHTGSEGKRWRRSHVERSHLHSNLLTGASSQEKQYHKARTRGNFENSMLNFSLQYKSLVQSIDYRSDGMNEVWSFQSVDINVSCSTEQERTTFLSFQNREKETILAK